jgi:hypothetical protein
MKFLLNSHQTQRQQPQALEEMIAEGGVDQFNQPKNYFDVMADFCFFHNLFGSYQRPA